MRYIRPAVTLRQHFLRLLRLILRPRTRPRLRRVLPEVLRLATQPHTTQPVLQGQAKAPLLRTTQVAAPRTRPLLIMLRLLLLAHQGQQLRATQPRITQVAPLGLLEPLRLRTIRAVGLLTALQPLTTLVVQQAQVRAPLPVIRLPTGLVAARVNQRLRAGLLLTVRHVGHLAEQLKPLAGLHLGQARLVNLRRELIGGCIRTRPIGMTCQAVTMKSIGMVLL